MNVMVLAHDASRTGAPMVLTRLLGAPRPAGVRVDVVLRRGGPLEDDLRRLADDLTVLQPGPGRGAAGSLSAGLAQLGLTRTGDVVRAADGRARARRHPIPDVVVVHGAGGAALLPAVRARGARLVVHLHELELGLRRSLAPAAATNLLRRADRVLVVSDPVADLAREVGAPPRLVEVVPGVVASARARATDARPVLARTVADQVGRAPDTTVVGVGTPGWRKGTDRLLSLAHELARTRPDAGVAWIGGPLSRPSPAGPVAWLPERADPWDLAAGADVVVVPSREDPLPLAALEAGAEGLPVVATRTGGLPALLAPGRGEVVGPGLRALTTAVTGLLDDPERRHALGSALRAHVLAHHSADVVAPAWWAAIGA